MKNTLNDVRNNLIAAMEEVLMQEEGKEIDPKRMEQLKLVNEFGKTLVESAKAEDIYLKVTGSNGAHVKSSGFVLPQNASDSL